MTKLHHEMDKDKISSYGLDFEANTELEIYRISTLLTKEPETIAWIESWVDIKGSCFFDIGSNIGLFGLYAAHHHRDLRVLSFEPESKNYTALSKNVLLNPDIRVEPFRFALSDEIGISNLVVTDERVGNSNSQVNYSNVDSRFVGGPMRIDPVFRTTLDFLVDSMNFPTPDYVKIDVDGHEDSILNGAQKLIEARLIKSLLVEFSDLQEVNKWKSKLSIHGYAEDLSFDQVPGHSKIRRQLSGALMRNIIFTRSDQGS